MDGPERIPWRLHALGLSLVAALVLAAYTPPLLHGLVYYSEDTTDLNYVVQRSFVNDLGAHGFVAWSPGIGTGHYRAADPTYALYSPRILLYFLFRGYEAQMAVILLYALLAGMGGYIAGAGLGRSWAAAVFMGAAWPLGGLMSGMVHNVPYFASAAWYPWALAAWTMPRRAGRRIPLTAACLAMVALDGDLFGLGFTLALLGMVSLFTTERKAAVRELWTWAAMGAAAAALAAVVWMPALADLPESLRARGLDFFQVTDYSLHPLELIGLFAPRFFGQFLEDSFWGFNFTTSIQGYSFWCQSQYLGLATPGLALAAFFAGRRKRRMAAGFLATAVVFALFAFGRHAPFFVWLQKTFPAVGLFRYPAKLFAWGGFSLLCAATVGLSGLGRAVEAADRRRGLALLLAALYGTALVAITAYAASSVDLMLRASHLPMLSARRLDQDLLRLAVGAAALPLMVYTLGSVPHGRRALPALLAIATGLDLLIALPVFPIQPRAEFSHPSKLVPAIKAAGPGRILVEDKILDHTLCGPRLALKPDWGILEGLEYGMGTTASMAERISGLYNLGLLKANTAAMFRILAVNYVVAPTVPPKDWIRKAATEGLLRVQVIDPDDNLTLFSTPERYPDFFLTRAVVPVPNKGVAFRLALDDHKMDHANPLVYLDMHEAVTGGTLIIPAPRPPAYAVGFNGGPRPPGRILSMDRANGDRLGIRAALDEPAALVVREYLMPGWGVRVDGNDQPIYFADGIGRLVFLPQGHHRIEFIFHAPGWAGGAVISVITALLLASLLVFSMRRGRSGMDSRN